MKIFPVILAGGSGKRLWPLSRKEYPKQFLPLASKNTMLQETILRLKGIDTVQSPIIICNIDHRFVVAEQCHQIEVKNPVILLEPIGRNTAPAIVAAAIYIKKIPDDGILLILSADHIIQDIQSFHDAIVIAKKQAEKGKLVTFGVVPTDANTGYGYIKADKNTIEGSFRVEHFIEKPNLKMAKKFLGNSSYFWNSGMFMFGVSELISELSALSPKIVNSVNDAVNNASNDLDFIRLDKLAFESSPSDSIDYALMEKSKNVEVVPLNSGWNDIGAWPALYNIGDKDSHGNVIKGDVLVQDTNNSFIMGDYHLVATIGVDNLIIVDTPDVTFVASMEKAQEVNNMVETIYKSGRNETDFHRKVYRPWGWFNSIESGKYFQVKRLFVKPGAKLSLQLHNHRAEHWVVIKGKASVTKGKKTFDLNKGESTFIPLGAMHALENKTLEALEIIEVQSGTYLGEDDIIRFEDIYGRTSK